MVSRGLTPSERGITDPSITYSPSCTSVEPAPARPSNTWHLWSTTPASRSASHAAAAQRMRGGRLLSHHRSRQRVLHVAAARLADQRLQRRVQSPVDRLVLRGRPADRDAIVLQHQPPRGAVVRHRKERLQSRERPLVDAGHQALQRPQQPTVGDEHHRQDRRQRRGQHALLDGQAVGQILLVDDLDLARHAGADIQPRHLLRIADADGIDRHLGAIAEGDDVAVGGEALRRGGRTRCKPCSRERSRISVLPSVPAASTTMSAVNRGGRRSASCGSRFTRQPPSPAFGDADAPWRA